MKTRTGMTRPAASSPAATLLLAGVLALLLAAFPAAPAAAFERLDDNGLCPAGIAYSAGRFSSGGSLDFDLAINHVKREMAVQKGLDWDALDILERFELVVWPFETTARELSRVGGSLMNVSVNLRGPISDDTSYYDIVDEAMNNLENDVIFSLIPGDDVDFSAITLHVVHSNCNIREADIIFANISDGWRFHEPRDYGVPYFNDRIPGADWMQLTFLHEMLHAVGFGHTADTYSFLNYGTWPWTKLDAASLDKEVPSPLPEDRKALREVYPDPNTGQFDLAVSNTWLDESEDPLNGAGWQERLCAPTRSREDLANPGNFVEFDRFGFGGCHQGGSYVLCPGQSSVAVAYTVSNHGQDPEWVIHELWFSADDHWDPNQDVLAPGSSSTLETLGEEESQIEEHNVEVPAGLAADTEYHLLVRIRRFSTFADQPGSGLQESSYRNNWIPLRGTVRTAPASPPCT
jgi:hypothetical protein